MMKSFKVSYIKDNKPTCASINAVLGLAWAKKQGIVQNVDSSAIDEKYSEVRRALQRKIYDMYDIQDRTDIEYRLMDEILTA